MKKNYPAAFILFTALLCAFAAGGARARASVRATRQPQAATPAESFTATVKRDEARFTLPIPARREWKWLLPETQESAREYAMDVKVLNEGKEYAFGFYVWKFRGAKPRSGSFSALIGDGQKSVFVRSQSRLMSVVRDAGVKAKQEGDRLIITVGGRKNVARLFSGRPAEVTFEISLPGDSPTSQTIPVKYVD